MAKGSESKGYEKKRCEKSSMSLSLGEGFDGSVGREYLSLLSMIGKR